jgi:hypothetical protein
MKHHYLWLIFRARGSRLGFGHLARRIFAAEDELQFKETAMADDHQKTEDKVGAINNDRERQLNTLIGLSEKFGDSLANAFAKNVSEGKKFDDVLKNVRRTFTEFSLRSATVSL